MNKIAVVSEGKILCGNKFSFHLGIYQGAQLLDLMSMFSFEKKTNYQTVFQISCIPTSNKWEYLSLPALTVVSVLDFGNSNKCVVGSHLLLFWFLWWHMMCSIIHMLTFHL